MCECVQLKNYSQTASNTTEKKFPRQSRACIDFKNRIRIYSEQINKYKCVNSIFIELQLCWVCEKKKIKIKAGELELKKKGNIKICIACAWFCELFLNEINAIWEISVQIYANFFSAQSFLVKNPFMQIRCLV